MSWHSPADLDEGHLPLLATAMLRVVGAAVAAILAQDGVDANLLDVFEARYPFVRGSTGQASDRMVRMIQ